MSDTHRVILTADALGDVQDIADYIRQNSPQNAASIAETILNAIDSLAFMPNRFRQAGRSRKRGSPVRAMVVRPFIIYYRIEDSPAAVYIVHIRHGKRRQPRRFD
ncbi:MAG TPA: type II toxin-antitoxin system RelE/ParE family toxin [Tepidisphaeraceae bacterium]|jgi:plasmid stabilization system protein ParE